MKTVRYNPLFADCCFSRKRSKLQVQILNQYFENDPEWNVDTYMKVAEEVGISPTQAYKWGYHQKLKFKSNNKNVGGIIRPSNYQQKNSLNSAKDIDFQKLGASGDSSEFKDLNSKIHSDGQLMHLNDYPFFFDNIEEDHLYFQKNNAFITADKISSLDLIIDEEQLNQQKIGEREFCIPVPIKNKEQTLVGDLSWIDSLFN